MPSSSSSARRTRASSRGPSVFHDDVAATKSEKRAAKRAAKQVAKRTQQEADKKGKRKAPQKAMKHEKSKKNNDNGGGGGSTSEATSHSPTVKQEKPHERRARPSMSSVTHVIDSDTESEHDNRLAKSAGQQQTPPSTSAKKHKRARSVPFGTPKSEAASQRSQSSPAPAPLLHARKMSNDAKRQLERIHAKMSELKAEKEQMPLVSARKRQQMLDRHKACLDKLQRGFEQQLVAIDAELETLRRDEAKEHDTIALMSAFFRDERPIVLDSSVDSSMAESGNDDDDDDDDDAH